MKTSRKDAKAQRELQREAVLLRQDIHDSLHTGLEQCCSEIDQQTKPFVCESKFREHLLAVNGRQFFDRLQFNNDEVLHNQVRAETFFENKVVVSERDGHLPLHFESSLAPLIGKHDFVNCFKQTRPESLVNVKSCIDDHFGDFIFVHEVRQAADPIMILQSLCASASLREAFPPWHSWN